MMTQSRQAIDFKPMECPVLETDRLILRGLEARDLDGFEEIYGDAEHSRFVSGPKSRFACWEKLTSLIGHWQLKGFGRFAVEERATGTFLGHCGPSETGFAVEREMNWAFTPYAQGKGFAFEAVRRALFYVYDILGWSTVVSSIDAKNVRSARLAGRLGATNEGSKTTDDGFTADIWRHLPPAQFKEKFA